MQAIGVGRFEVVRDKETAEVALFFIGAVRVDEGAAVAISGSDVIVSRNSFMPLRFEGLSAEHQGWVEAAPALYVNRTCGGEDEMVRVGIPSRREPG